MMGTMAVWLEIKYVCLGLNKRELFLCIFHILIADSPGMPETC